jgi:hypothetical protein
MVAQSKERVRSTDVDREQRREQPSRMDRTIASTSRETARTVRSFINKLERNWPLSAALILFAIVILSIL